MSGSLKPYFYVVCWTGAAENSLQKRIKAFCVVWDGEYICQDSALRTEDKAIMLVLCNVNTHTDHNDTPDMFI